MNNRGLCPTKDPDCKISYIDGDGVEWETWGCKKCKAQFEIPISIMRFWDHAVELDEDDK